MLRPLVYLLIGQCAERVFDHDRNKLGHAERVALHLCFVQKFDCHDDCGRAAGGFEPDAVMRTARRTRPSVADRRQDDVVIGCDRLDQCGIRIL